MLLADVVATSTTVASTRARSAKVAALAELVRRLAPEEVEPAVAFLSGEARQGRVGVGWATVGSIDVPAAAAPSITVLELDDVVTRLAATTGPGSVAARAALLDDLFRRSTAAEADFLRRLLLGELRQGALEGIVTDAVAKAAGVPLDAVRRAAMFAGDLPLVAATAMAEGEAGLAAVGLRPLHPVQPMLASTAADVAEAIAGCGPASVEWKLDGARIQVHRVAEKVRVFTRNLNEVTDRLPGIADAVRTLPAHALVLDGEAIGLGADRPQAFQDTMSRFGRQDGSGAGLVALFFDCLHVDGTDLVDEPLAGRLDALERVAGPLRMPGIRTEDPAAAAAFLEATLAAGHEGVMVKALSSRYEAGRRGGAWRKVKPVLTFDLVVLAAEWGHGRRRGWLSNLHLGARDPAGGFVMVGKTFKGMTDEMLTWQTARLLELETVRDGIVVHVRPELVVEVALDGVQASPRYKGGVALRFARIKHYREDKAAADADTIDAVRALLPRRT